MQGILFKPEMTLANLKGLKTRTSRTRGLKKINENPGEWELADDLQARQPTDGVGYFFFRNKTTLKVELIRCPFGSVGSELYGKETYHVLSAGSMDGTGKDIVYRASDPDFPYGWQSPMMMPEWASRYHIILEKIIVQRIQEISEEDCVKEGITERTRLPGYDPMYAMTFMILWDSINGKTYPWSSNPWVWVLYYRVEKK